MRMNKDLRSRYYNVCYKGKINSLFNNEQMSNQFYAQRRLLESMLKGNEEELDSILEKALEKAHNDFNFFTTLS